MVCRLILVFDTVHMYYSEMSIKKYSTLKYTLGYHLCYCKRLYIYIYIHIYLNC